MNLRVFFKETEKEKLDFEILGETRKNVRRCCCSLLSLKRHVLVNDRVARMPSRAAELFHEDRRWGLNPPRDFSRDYGYVTRMITALSFVHLDCGRKGHLQMKAYTRTLMI